MKRFHSNDAVSTEVMDAALLVGAKAVDGDSDSLSGVHSLQFDDQTVIFSIAKIHSDYNSLRPVLLKNFLGNLRTSLQLCENPRNT